MIRQLLLVLRVMPVAYAVFLAGTVLAGTVCR